MRQHRQPGFGPFLTNELGGMIGQETRSPGGIIIPPTPRIRAIATRGYVSASGLSVTTNKVMSRRWHYFPAPFSDIGGTFHNWYVSASAGFPETGAGGPVTVAMSLEYVPNTSFKQLLWSGASTITIGDLSEGESDLMPLGFTLPAGWYPIRTFADWSAGAGMAVFDDIGADSNYNTILGDAQVYSGATDQTMSGVVTPQAGSSSVCAGVIFGTTIVGAVAIFGDSRGFGNQDTADATGDTGYPARALLQRHGSSKFCRSGGTWASFLSPATNFNRRKVPLKFFDKAMFVGPTNDIRTGTSAIIAWGYFEGVGAFCNALDIPWYALDMERWTDVTVPPATDPDGADQIANANEAGRQTFNTGLHGASLATNLPHAEGSFNPSIITALIDSHGATLDPKWRLTDTDDYHHCNVIGTVRVRDSGAISEPAFRRVGFSGAPSPFKLPDARLEFNFDRDAVWLGVSGRTKTTKFASTTTRAGTRNVLQANGAYLAIAANLPPLGANGAYIEEGWSNILGLSNAIGASWVATNITPTAGQTSPDGLNTASSLLATNAGTVSHNIQPPSKSFVAASNYQTDVWNIPNTGGFMQFYYPAQGGDGTEFVNFDPATGSVVTGGSIVAAFAQYEGVLAGWHLSFIGPAAAGGGARSLIMQRIGSMAAARAGTYIADSALVNIWNPQVGVASPTTFNPRSPIITTSSVTVVKAGDVMTIQRSVLIDVAAQTIYGEFYTPVVTLVPGATVLAGSGDKGVLVTLDSVGNRARLQVLHGAVRGDTGNNGPVITAGQLVKWALSYDGVNPCLFSVNNTTVASAATPAQTDFDANDLYLGSRSGGTLYLNAPIKTLGFAPVKTQVELNALTA